MREPRSLLRKLGEDIAGVVLLVLFIALVNALLLAIPVPENGHARIVRTEQREHGN